MSTILPAATVALLAACSSARVPPPRSTPSTTTTATPTSGPRATPSTTPIPSTPTPSTPTSSTSGPSATPTPPGPTVPPVSAAARRAGLHDVRAVVPDAIVDLRYATTHNFTGVRLYPADARCLVHASMLRGLAAAARAARERGLQLVFWDCYRPHEVQVRMFEVVPNPNWVARPGRYARSHESGRSVDVTLARGGDYLDMGTGFDDFTPRATAYATSGVSTRAEGNRALLRKIMGTGGLSVYRGEWWHFDAPDADRNRPYLGAPVD